MDKKRINLRNANNTEKYVMEQFNLLREGILYYLNS